LNKQFFAIKKLVIWGKKILWRSRSGNQYKQQTKVTSTDQHRTKMQYGAASSKIQLENCCLIRLPWTTLKKSFSFSKQA